MNTTPSHVALVNPACSCIFFLSFIMKALNAGSEALRASSAGVSVSEIYEEDVFIDEPTTWLSIKYVRMSR